jgi:hypothetical protein
VRQSRTPAWFVTKVQGRVCEDVLDIAKRKSYVPAIVTGEGNS